jgi:Notch 1
MWCAGYRGKVCDENPNDCLGVTCKYGTCIDGLNNYTCRCQLGYGGLLCDIEIDECQSQPCQYGGTCINAKGAYICVCPPGTTGKLQVVCGRNSYNLNLVYLAVL